MTQTDKRTIHCFFSGGRDSAVSCAIAKKVADIKDWNFKLVHIDTTIYLQVTREYIFKYADWLKADLIIIGPEKTFEEYAAKYGMWPSLHPPQYRWCYYELKLDPTITYLKNNYRTNDIVVIGVKRWDSDARLNRYTNAFFIRDYGRLKVNAWAPLWNATDEIVERLIKQLNIPRNPAWKFGTSGECLCLAGMPERKIRVILKNCPEIANRLLKIDRIIQENRKSKTPSAPPAIWQKGFKTLEEYYRYIIKQKQLDEFIVPYSGCEGHCML